MISRGLIERQADTTEIVYRAGEFAETFFASLARPYLVALRERATWIAATFGEMEEDSFREVLSAAFGRWIEEFQFTPEKSGSSGMTNPALTLRQLSFYRPAQGAGDSFVRPWAKRPYTEHQKQVNPSSLKRWTSCSDQALTCGTSLNALAMIAFFSPLKMVRGTRSRLSEARAEGRFAVTTEFTTRSAGRPGGVGSCSQAQHDPEGQPFTVPTQQDWFYGKTYPQERGR